MILLVIATLALATLTLLHVDGINGPWYWRWPWRINHGLWPYIALAGAAIPTFIAALRFGPNHGEKFGVALMMFTSLFAMLVVRMMDTPTSPFARIVAITEEPGSIGYFTHAQQFLASGHSLRWLLGNYVDWMPRLTLHARNKPPGSLLFFVPFLKLAATQESAALASGLAIALLAALGVGAAYFLIGLLTGDRAAAYHGAAYFSLCPSLLVFLPEFDQFYPLYTALLIGLWIGALHGDRWRCAVGFGLLWDLVCFQTFNLLTLGVFFAGYAAIEIVRDHLAWRRVLRQVAIAGATAVALYALLWLWSGYNPIAALRTGIADHQQDMPGVHRHWPETIPWDLYDFLLGAGWIAALLIVFYLFNQPPRRFFGPIVLLALAQPIAVALVGVLQGETARVWIFMLPLLMVPIGLQLAAYPRGARMIVLACLWLLMAILSQNMVFV